MPDSPRDWFTREAVTGLCPGCGAGWTGSPCSHCHYEAPVPVDFQGRPFVPSPAPREDIASRARGMANDTRLSMVPVARHLLDECATEIDALNRKLIDMYERIIPEQIAVGLAAAPRAPRDEARESAIDVLRWFAKRQWHFLLAPEQNDQTFCARSVQALGAAEWLAAAPRADRTEPTDEAIRAYLTAYDHDLHEAGSNGVSVEQYDFLRHWLGAAYAVDFPAAARAPGRET